MELDESPFSIPLSLKGSAALSRALTSLPIA
jgi:hypothetical protein